MMNRNEAKKRIKSLRKEINRLRDKYHKEDTSEISDEALDSLKHELKQIEDKYPELITKDSPTQTISGEVKEGFEKIEHKIKQWSFNDIFTEQELFDFDKKIKRYLKKEDIDYFVEEKIDGIKIIIEYKKGKLYSAATRGDGSIGEDITENAKTIKDLPITLKKDIDVIVEGEVWMGTKELERINKEREKKGESTYANPRNLTAGSLRQLNPKVTAERNLRLFIYDIAKMPNFPKTQKEEFDILKALGFPTNKKGKVCKSTKEITTFWEKSSEKRDSMEYWIDGVVIKVNSKEYQDRLGYTGKAPRFAVAFKFPSEQATTVIEDIVFQLGRTGVVTPVAEFTDVILGGTNVKRATLHNEDQINKLDVRVGDTVIIQKAGDIIPEVVSVIKNLRPKNSKKFKFPKKIKECGGDGSIEKVPGKAQWRCVDRDSFELQIKRLSYFTSKNAFDIEGFGEKTVRQFFTEGIVSEYKDIFNLDRSLIEKLPLWKEKSISNLLEAVESKRKITLSRLLIALSIDGLGEETAILLSRRFKTIDSIMNVPKEELKSIDGLGDVIADSIYNWMRDKGKNKILKELLKEIEVQEDKFTTTNSKLSQKTIVITGTLSISRDELKSKLRSAGAFISESISKKTDYLIAGEKAGSKLKKAKELKINILKEEDLDKII